jgi:glycosyltransferase involved in cell wall biosynthesis
MAKAGSQLDMNFYSNSVTLGCWVTVYNEERRIGRFLEHARRWADEIVIADKCSTDNTKYICESAGCVVISLPYSEQGQEDVVMLFDRYRKVSKTEWAIWMTPGEVPTKDLIASSKAVIADPKAKELQNILIPVKIYSFGAHLKDGPWRDGYQPRLLNVGRFQSRQRIHNHIISNVPPVAIPHTKTKYILHLTHANFDKYASSHISYAKQEAADTNNPLERARNALIAFDQFPNPDINRLDPSFRQVIAWKTYQLLVMLACLDRLEDGTSTSLYESLTLSHLEQEWNYRE